MRRKRERWLAQKHCPKGMHMWTSKGTLRVPAALYDRLSAEFDGLPADDPLRQHLPRGDVVLLVMERLKRQGFVDIDWRKSKHEGGRDFIVVTLRPRGSA